MLDSRTHPLLALQKQDHPNPVNLNAPHPRQMNYTLQSKIGNSIRSISTTNLSPEDYIRNLKIILSKSVKNMLNSMADLISDSVKDLPRTARTTLLLTARINNTNSTSENFPHCPVPHTTV